MRVRLASIRGCFAALLSIAQLGCLASRSSVGRECLDRREVLVYMSKLRESIAAEWEKPPGAGGMVIVGARVSDVGEIRSASVIVRTRSDMACSESLRCRMIEKPLRRSMEAALRKARPVGPPPEAAACIVGESLWLTFETSEPFVQDPQMG
jgi:hypothetical protein